MKTLAAILVELNKPLVIDEIEIPKLKPGQVLVEINFSGLCHTQLLEARGHRGDDNFLPHLLGHEGSGKVLEIGSDVKKVKPGDRVILSWMKGSGSNEFASQYNWNGKNVNSGAITTFSKYSVISENRLTPLTKSLPLKIAALIGCALPTGLGAVFNTARPKPGQSLAVFGCGGVGLSALQGAIISGCAPVIAIDINEKKLEMAKNLGATHIINAKKDDPIESIKQICQLDFAIEASGSPIAMEQALLAVKQRGGTAIIIGNAHHGKNVTIDPKQFNLGKKLLGTWGGDNNPDIHFPRYCSLIEHNYCKTDHLTSDTYSLNQINSALEDLENGKVLRPIIDMSL
ncbi:MAG: Aryl-alcohol dehydrogenase [Candidatus Anoxychlamydiales bacterium]|nr:Aryl-alcohol dehydrogenase [Candidatus Anoxychlamydiales bacterium]NGX35521.1 Aryl-alcohol dehydrogenase [Candidatus Anoxychlamydiales bacterium]